VSAAPRHHGARRSIRVALTAVLSLILLVTGIPVLALTQAEPAVQLSRLLLEKKVEPIGIDVERPRFSWIIDSDGRGVEQRSYRLRLATSETALDSGDLVWDSGVVESPESANVEYTGPALRSATDYAWRIDVVTTHGSSTATSRFRTGLYDEQDWAGSEWIGNARTPDELTDLTFDGASWIWTPEASTAVAPAEDRAFRTTRTSPAGKTATNAEVLITADDSYRLSVNGRVLGETAGANNEWQQSHLYETALRPDRNVFAVRTTNGEGSPAGLIAVIRTTYADGTTSTFTTGPDWKASKTVPAGFAEPDFDDSAWGNAVEQAAYGGGPWGGNVRAPKQKVRPAPLLRREFDVAPGVEDATLYVAAGGYANVSVNGEPASDQVLSPGFTDYDDTVQYVALDLTEALHPGTNALGMELGRGFYGMTGGNVWRWESAPWHDEPVVRALLHVEYADGSTEQLVTDDSWTIHDGPTVFDDLYAGETYDARLVQPGYDTVGFDDTSWAPASEVDGPRGVLVNQRQQPIRVTESLPAVEITEPAPDVYVVKFPRVLAGWVEFTAQGPAGTTIRAQYGEKLKDDGRPNFSNNGNFQSGFQTDRFILAGIGEPESWESRFSYKGFQYIEVTGWPGEQPPPLSAFTAKAVHTDAAETGTFESSSDIMNRTHRAVVDTMKNNIHGIPTDTPMFEKNGWTGDAAVGAEMFLTNLDVHELFAKWMRDLHETRDEEGAPLVIAPSSGDWGEWGVVPPWHSAYVMIPWWLYQYGGDSRVLTENYDGMKTYVDLEFDRSENGIVANPRLGDWVAPEASPAGGNPPEDLRVSGTAYLYAMLTSMQRSAEFLGKDADAARFAENAAVVKTAFNDAFLDRAAGYYRGVGDKGYRQTHNVLALAFGLVPDDRTAQRVADSIVADVRAKGTKLNTGVLGTKYLLPVLTDYGHADVAYELAVQTGYPSWGYMIENGATSMWEHWSLEARSRGHYFLGTVDDWFYKHVAGIQASELTGYRDITIAPAVTDQMPWAKASTQTPYGTVSSDWRRTGRTLTLDVTIPVGSKATVVVPADNRWAVTESGRPVGDADGVTGVSDGDGVVRVEIGSGHYSFRSDERMGLAGRVIGHVDELRATVEELRDAGTFNAGQASRLLGFTDAARAGAMDTLTRLRADDALGAARTLTDGLDALSEVETALSRMRVDDAAKTRLQTILDAASQALGVAASDYLQVRARATTAETPVLPGGSATVTVGLDNAGPAVLHNVRAVISGLPDGWAASPRQARLANAIEGGSTAERPFSLRLPKTQLPAEVDAEGALTYGFDDARIELTAPIGVTVASPVSIRSVTAAPGTVRPGRTVEVTTVVGNVGRAGAAGRVEFAVPDGWTAPAPVDIEVPAGATREVTSTVAVPRNARQAVTDVELLARVVRDDAVLATGKAPLRVEIDPAPDVAEGYDHVDLGVSAAEQAHALSASESSGTSTEAGLTRRYAGHLTPFSYFEFDAAVVPGQPFVLRVTETYDRAQTKRYKVYVDGEEVLLRTFSHDGGAGTETYEFVVPAEFTTDGTVRVKFENQDDPAFYDPSIADVWTRPIG
jgi:alpha-L-rhamnosidase